MQRYKRGSRSVACVVTVTAPGKQGVANVVVAKVKAFPMGVCFYFFVVPKLLGPLCSDEAQEGALSTFECQGFSQKNLKTFYK